jgi:photosystem II stability/assembly factor-like uncharacterized protein
LLYFLGIGILIVGSPSQTRASRPFHGSNGGPGDSVRIGVAAGWNMLSLPLLQSSSLLNGVFPDASSSLFRFNNGYVSQDSISIGYGFWLKFPQAETFTVRGERRLIDYMSVRTGWNLVGGFPDTVLASDLVSNPEAIMSSPFYGYDSGIFTQDDSLLPGRAYWLKSASDGTILARKWEELGFIDEDVSTIAIDPSNPSIFYVGTMYNFSTGQTGKLFKTTDAGTTWDTLLIGGSVNNIVIDPTSPETLFVTFDGVIKSTDGGGTWQSADSGIALDPETFVQCLQMDPHDGNILFAGTSGFGSGSIYETTNGGQSWIDRGIGYDTLRSGVTSIAIDPSNSDIVYAGTPWVGAIHKSTDGGLSWHGTGLGETGSIVNDIRVSADDQNIVLAAIDFVGFVISTDAGQSWNDFNEGLPPNRNAMQSIFVGGSTARLGIATVGDEGWIYFMDSGETVWRRIGINYLRHSYYYGCLSLVPDASAVYFGGRGLFRMKLK